MTLAYSDEVIDSGAPVMTKLEEFEASLANAEAALAGLRQSQAQLATGGGEQSAILAAPAFGFERPAVPGARRWSRTTQNLVCLICLTVAFLQYYYIEVQLQIISLPALFPGPLH
jgi:hypothetical protein